MNLGWIGGLGLEVQINETVIFRRKYRVIRLTGQIWLVGGVCLTQPSGLFLVIVGNRNNETITNMLSDWPLPGSILITDERRPYISAAIISGMERHEIVNPSREFVSARDITQTQYKTYGHVWNNGWEKKSILIQKAKIFFPISQTLFLKRYSGICVEKFSHILRMLFRTFD